MYFCPLCCNLLVPEHQQSVNLVCTSCPYTYRVVTSLVNAAVGSLKEVEKIAGEEDAMKNANKCQIRCPKCSHEEAFYIEIQTRSADEPMTIFYQCAKCKFNWKD